MTLKEYEERAMSTCMKSCKNFTYMAFGLLAESGEIADKVAKGVRSGKASIYMDGLTSPRCFPSQKELQRSDAVKDEILKEVGDVLWFCAGLAKVCGSSLEEVAKANLRKLSKRKASGTIVTHKDH